MSDLVAAERQRAPLSGMWVRLGALMKPGERRRLFRFALVGLSGVVVNQGFLWIGVSFAFASLAWKPRVAVASVVAIGLSIISNFLLNDAWTWGERSKTDHWLARFGRYALVASVAGLLQWFILKELVAVSVHYLLANLVGIGAGIVVNYYMNNRWTFRRSGAA